MITRNINGIPFSYQNEQPSCANENVLKSLHFFIICFIATDDYQQIKKDLDGLKNLDQNLLFKALKHKEIQNDEDFNEDDRDFLRKITKGELLYIKFVRNIWDH